MSLHTCRREAGAPLVVFESGVGANRGTWTLVEPQVRSSTLVYDRPGLGRSPRGGRPRTVAAMTQDLVALLAAEGARDCVLVGHSLGGVLVRYAQHLRPDLVRALVLVDQVQEELPVYLDERHARLVSLGYRAGSLLARTGLLRLLLGNRLHRDFPPEVRAEITAEELAPGALATAAEEVRLIPAGLRALPPLARPDIPVTVISGGRPGPHEKRSRPVLVAAHRAYAAGLAHGRHVLAEQSDHLVPLRQPDLVAAEINRLL
ncbi:pimeloyl-ACP methyl ester carboxylesterase [Crossiella equi]|uniref:Pimeloyl-ACP methyl ester carboxylesterase n=1 Tax=Crossiella equi TaxID=130796 RepID=A0ABS5AEG6_9PSEU|nr:alpha/beta hydrolase [Crossiella equi]MBP2474978.1 pimeloyl-ACP methyl ester carboxylesterase [Crossiella equi]